jgi:hypothetical protein
LPLAYRECGSLLAPTARPKIAWGEAPGNVGNLTAL